MSAANPYPPQGWCDNRGHGGTLHQARTDCTDFESDADFTARMIEQSREHDRQMAGYVESRYVAQTRPY